jgi:hypothetical protein
MDVLAAGKSLGTATEGAIRLSNLSTAGIKREKTTPWLENPARREIRSTFF